MQVTKMRGSTPSPALGRLLGSIGFFGGAMLCLHMFARVFGTNQPLFDTPAGEWTRRTWALAVLSGVFGTVFMAMGWEIAVKIDVRSAKTDHSISTFWHYMTNDSLFWWAAIPNTLSIILGHDGAMAFIKDYGVSVFFTRLTVVSVTGGAAIAATCLVLKLTAIQDFKLAGVLFVNTLAMLVMGKIAFVWLGISSWSWVLLGITGGLFLPAVNQFMVARDGYSRARTQGAEHVRISVGY